MLNPYDSGAFEQDGSGRLDFDEFAKAGGRVGSKKKRFGDLVFGA